MKFVFDVALLLLNKHVEFHAVLVAVCLLDQFLKSVLLNVLSWHIGYWHVILLAWFLFLLALKFRKENCHRTRLLEARIRTCENSLVSSCRVVLQVKF